MSEMTKNNPLILILRSTLTHLSILINIMLITTSFQEQKGGTEMIQQNKQLTVLSRQQVSQSRRNHAEKIPGWGRWGMEA